MRLRSLKITAYRSCLNTTLAPHPKLTALIGINGVGKTNLLNAIMLLRKIVQASQGAVYRSGKSTNQCGVSFELIHKDKIIRAKGLVYYETNEKNQDNVLFSTIKWNFRDHLKNGKWFEIPFDLLTKHFRKIKDALASDMYKHITSGQAAFPKDLIPVIQELYEFLAGTRYYSASQFADPSRCPISIELDDDSPIKKINDQFGHEQFILDLYRISKSNGKIYDRYINTITKPGLHLVDGIDFQTIDLPSSTYEVKSGGKVKQIEKTRSIIVPSFRIGKNNLSPNQLSEGTLKTLAILFYTLTDDSKLLLIEEPEVCVHQGLLDSIIEIIKSQSGQKQIVISTHSDYVLDLLSPENVVLLTKEDNAGTTASPLTTSMSKNDFEALRRYLQETGTLGGYWKESGFDFN